MSTWQMISKIGQGLAWGVRTVSDGVSTAAAAIAESPETVRKSMAVTEITSVFNTTDETIKFVNRETPRDSREILGQSAVSLKTDKTAGAWIPWYDPPRFPDFARRHMEVQLDGEVLLYIWQRGEQVCWTNQLNSAGRPINPAVVAGAAHVGGQRTLVVRNAPDGGISVFLSQSVHEPGR